MNDSATRRLVGMSIWNAANWIHHHSPGEPYEIFDGNGDPETSAGWRILVERINPGAHHGHDPKKGCRRCIRGLLCSRCNRWGVPLFLDAMIRAINYLTDPPARKVLLAFSD